MTKHLTKEEKALVNKLKQCIRSAKTSKDSFRRNIQTALEIFVKEYNGALTYNGQFLKDIVLVAGREVTSVRNWLLTYTNLTKVYADIVHFETTESTEVDGEKKFILKFNADYNGQKWYETKIEKEEKKFDKVSFQKSAESLYKKYMKEEIEQSPEMQTILQAIKKAYKLA